VAALSGLEALGLWWKLRVTRRRLRSLRTRIGMWGASWCLEVGQRGQKELIDKAGSVANILRARTASTNARSVLGGWQSGHRVGSK